MSIRIPTLAALFAAVLLLAGCSLLGPRQRAEPTQDKIKITIMHNWTVEDGKAKAMREVMERFRAEHPLIEVEEEGLSTDGLKARLRTLAAADEMPDLFVMWPDAMTRDFVRGDLLQPIDDFLNEEPEWRDNFIPNAFDGYTVGGKIYSVPMNRAPTSLIYYNKALFDRYNVKVPTTWQELIDAVEAFNRHHLIPIALGNKSNWFVQSTIFSTLADRVTGTDWFLRAVAQDGASFTDPEFIEALRLLQDFGKLNAFQPGFNGIDDNQMMQLYFTGQAAMVINGGWAASGIVQNAPKEVLDHTHVTILPAVEGGRGNPHSTSGVVGTGLGVNKKLTGDKKAAAMKLFYALSGPDGQRATLDSNTLISYKLELDKSTANPMFVELNELMQSVEVSPVYDVKLSAVPVEAMNSGLQELLLGEDPEEVARKIQEAYAGTMGN
ncbi:extracellular solute-binding protein [Cohnella boryungensis]|uniref:Extracellular solute-binding protein n=1 Tax=Cohnella boryungensis TaxID=768479 RepID=A0ABV8SFM0_9BACL